MIVETEGPGALAVQPGIRPKQVDAQVHMLMTYIHKYKECPNTSFNEFH